MSGDPDASIFYFLQLAELSEQDRPQHWDSGLCNGTSASAQRSCQPEMCGEGSREGGREVYIFLFIQDVSEVKAKKDRSIVEESFHGGSRL